MNTVCEDVPIGDLRDLGKSMYITHDFETANYRMCCATAEK